MLLAVQSASSDFATFHIMCEKMSSPPRDEKPPTSPVPLRVDTSPMSSDISVGSPPDQATDLTIPTVTSSSPERIAQLRDARCPRKHQRPKKRPHNLRDHPPSPPLPCSPTPSTDGGRSSSPERDVNSELEDYFKPLKKLKMASKKPAEGQSSGLPSFNIHDILQHRPVLPSPVPNAVNSIRLYRPWDFGASAENAAAAAAAAAFMCAPPNFFPSLRHFHPHLLAGFPPIPPQPHIPGPPHGLSPHSSGGRPPHVILSSPNNDEGSSTDEQPSDDEESGQRGKNGEESPLDALFQMTNKTFDGFNRPPPTGEFVIFCRF